MASRAQTRNIGYFERTLQPEVQPRFRRNRDLLAMGPNLYAGACAADAFRCLLTSRLSHSPHIAANDAVRFAPKRNAGKLHGKLTPPLPVTRRLRIDEFEICISAGRQNYAVTCDDGCIERRSEKLASVIRFGIDSIHGANNHKGVSRNPRCN